MAPPRIAVVFYSMYGHIHELAKAELRGIQAAGGNADIYQIAETVPDEVLKKAQAPPKPPYPIAEPETLLNYDAFLFGIPTRFGSVPSQFKTFWDKTGSIWARAGYYGKYAGLFVSTGTLGGGQETTALAMMSTLSHHGIIYVPFGYKHSIGLMSRLDESHGGSAWGAGTLAAGDGSRQPSELELQLAEIQGKVFYETVSRVDFARQ